MALNNPISRGLATGSYVADDSNGRQIAVGFKCSMVIVTRITTARMCVMTKDAWHRDNAATSAAQNKIHANDGFIVDGTAEPYCNVGTEVFHYFAIGE